MITQIYESYLGLLHIQHTIEFLPHNGICRKYTMLTMELIIWKVKEEENNNKKNETDLVIMLYLVFKLKNSQLQTFFK